MTSCASVSTRRVEIPHSLAQLHRTDTDNNPGGSGLFETATRCPQATELRLFRPVDLQLDGQRVPGARWVLRGASSGSESILRRTGHRMRGVALVARGRQPVGRAPIRHPPIRHSAHLVIAGAVTSPDRSRPLPPSPCPMRARASGRNDGWRLFAFRRELELEDAQLREQSRARRSAVSREPVAQRSVLGAVLLVLHEGGTFGWPDESHGEPVVDRSPFDIRDVFDPDSNQRVFRVVVRTATTDLDVAIFLE